MGADFDEQTPLLIGAPIARRLHLGPPAEPWLDFRLATGTSADTDVWRDADQLVITTTHHAAHTAAVHWLGVSSAFDTDVTPLLPDGDPALIWQRTISELVFNALIDQWRTLTVPSTAGAETSADVQISEDSPKAWRAFQEFRAWLNLTDEEAADMLGLGKKTAYGWRRTGREPQPRLARRLYEAHAFVRQMVLLFGQDEAARLIHQGGDSSAASLIRANQVAEAEARFASVIYARAPRSEVPVGASRPGDADIPTEDDAGIVQKSGGRRRAEARRRG